MMVRFFSRNSASPSAATPAACASAETFHGGTAADIFRSNASSALRPYPSRSPAIPKLFVKALRIKSCGKSDRDGVRSTPPSDRLKKHSSTKSAIFFSRQMRRISSSKSSAMSRPVGLFGLQRNSASIFSRARIGKKSFRKSKFSSCLSAKRTTSQPVRRKASEYSENVGASSIARLGRTAPQ